MSQFFSSFSVWKGLLMLFTKHSCLKEGSPFPLLLLVTTLTGEQTIPDRILQSWSISGPFCPRRKKPLCYLFFWGEHAAVRWLVVGQHCRVARPAWREATEDDHPCPHPCPLGKQRCQPLMRHDEHWGAQSGEHGARKVREPLYASGGPVEALRWEARPGCWLALLTRAPAARPGYVFPLWQL